ncbi:MAG TPA: squalene--hopene cyclase [Gaiellaceae bacterium]|jgi:squalene-hopene/tetraprenyl-beta-curcumene cyclase
MTVLETRPDTLDRARDALDAAVGRLFDLQTEGGWWCGELESNVTMTAQHLFLLEFLRLRDEETTSKLVNELLARQRDDGTWAIYWGGEPDLAATIEAYAALRIAGFEPDDPRLGGARRFAEESGGIGASRVFTRIWLALFGLWSWDEIPQLPPELVLMRPELPLSVYSFSCWARQTIAALTVVMHYRPVRKLPPGRACHELNLGPAPRQTTLGKISDRLLARYGRARIQPGRERALDYAERWIIDRQELDGSWGGIQPPWVWSLIALACRGHGPDSPYLRRGLAGWNRFLVDEGDRLRPEACQSPVWDTALVLLGLHEAGRSVDEPDIRRAIDWMVAEEVRQRGDWAVRLPGVEPAGWAFEYDNDLYPDVDDVSVIALALRGLEAGGGAVERAIRWLGEMQCANGGWAAFDVDNDAYWLYRIPFCDFGAIIDPPSVDVAAHCVELLAAEPGYEEHVHRGLDYLLRKQEPDGSWFGRWGVNYVYGTGAALPALAAAGVPSDDPAVRRAVEWLRSVQNADGGFGEDCRSYDAAEGSLDWHGRGVSTASQTAWALMGLVAAGEARSDAAAGAATWLADTQREDGDWDEEHFTGTGFPRDFLIRYHLYRIAWPVIALARFKRALS